MYIGVNNNRMLSTNKISIMLVKFVNKRRISNALPKIKVKSDGKLLELSDQNRYEPTYSNGKIIDYLPNTKFSKSLYVKSKANSIATKEVNFGTINQLSAYTLCCKLLMLKGYQATDALMLRIQKEGRQKITFNTTVSFTYNNRLITVTIPTITVKQVYKYDAWLLPKTYFTDKPEAPTKISTLNATHGRYNPVYNIFICSNSLKLVQNRLQMALFDPK